MDLTNQMPIATKSSKIDISLEKNTESISKKFSNIINKGDIIFFYGEIGVGKTTFIKYLINNLQSKSGLKSTEVPSTTFNIERFIPLLMIQLNIAPEAPTRAPVIINKLLLNVKPIPQAAQPEYELSIEITTGMSAPPIGMTTRKPNKIEITTIVQKIVGD